MYKKNHGDLENRLNASRKDLLLSFFAIGTFSTYKKCFVETLITIHYKKTLTCQSIFCLDKISSSVWITFGKLPFLNKPLCHVE